MTKTLTQAVAKLERDPEHTVTVEVNGMVIELRCRSRRTASADAGSPERGSPDALLRHAGSLQFDPGKLDRILVEIDEMKRLGELATQCFGPVHGVELERPAQEPARALGSRPVILLARLRPSGTLQGSEGFQSLVDSRPGLLREWLKPLATP